jgi:hypothetical protein
MIKKILMIIAALIFVLVIVGFMLPRKMTVTHSLVIAAPDSVVFYEVNNLDHHPAWSYWDSLYKGTMKVTYGEIKSGVGAVYKWEGKESGSGKMTITESIPYKTVKMDLDFMEQGTAKTWYTFEAQGSSTKVTTGIEADMGTNPIMRILAVLLMKPEMMKAFDYNLNHLKKIAEGKKPGIE